MAMLDPVLLDDGPGTSRFSILCRSMASSFPDGEPSRRGTGDNYSMTDAVVPAAGDRWIYHFTHVDNRALRRGKAC
jgi:hypothetical protein